MMQSNLDLPRGSVRFEVDAAAALLLIDYYGLATMTSSDGGRLVETFEADQS
jgi:hypothetical protein